MPTVDDAVTQFYEDVANRTMLNKQSGFWKIMAQLTEEERTEVQKKIKERSSAEAKAAHEARMAKK